VISRTHPAKSTEYIALKRELESPPYDYKLVVRARRPARQPPGRWLWAGGHGSRLRRPGSLCVGT
jgi:hypothetical protein